MRISTNATGSWVKQRGKLLFHLSYVALLPAPLPPKSCGQSLGTTGLGQPAPANAGFPWWPRGFPCPPSGSENIGRLSPCAGDPAFILDGPRNTSPFVIPWGLWVLLIKWEFHLWSHAVWFHWGLCSKSLYRSQHSFLYHWLIIINILEHF